MDVIHMSSELASDVPRIQSRAAIDRRTMQEAERIEDNYLAFLSYRGEVSLLVNGQWRETPWNFRRISQNGVVTTSASREELMITNSSSMWLERISCGSTRSLPYCGVARDEPAICHVNGRTIVAGGEDYDYITLAAVEILHPGNNAWRRLPDMPRAASDAIAVSIGRHLYIVGGSIQGGDDVGYEVQHLPCLQIFDTLQEVWKTGPDMPEGFWPVTATVVEGEIFVAGQSEETGITACFCFTPDSTEWKIIEVFGLNISGQRPDSPRDSTVHAVNHKGRLLLLLPDEEHPWHPAVEMGANGEWSMCSLDDIPGYPFSRSQMNHIFSIVLRE